MRSGQRKGTERPSKKISPVSDAEFEAGERTIIKEEGS
jgi:hypothetical protein